MEKHLGLPLNFPPNASTHGAELDYLTAIVHWFMIILFVGWGLFYLYCLFRFRRGKNPVASYGGAKGKFSTYGEAGVVLIEVVLLVLFAVPIWAKRVSAVPSKADAVELRVIAEQFAWNVHYPGADGVFGRTDVKKVTAGGNPLGIDFTDPAAQDDVITLNQLHLPVNKPALIYLSSKDVIHSFFLPQMRVKQDAIPGQVIPVYFTPNQVTPPDAQFPACASAKPKNCWEIACAQLCGLTHYRMQGYYTVHAQADFDKWLADNAPKTATATPAAVSPLPAPPAPTGEPVTPGGRILPGTGDPVGGDRDEHGAHTDPPPGA
jgi:cytochrome c oxidase subunit 2